MCLQQCVWEGFNLAAPSGVTEEYFPLCICIEADSQPIGSDTVGGGQGGMGGVKLGVGVGVLVVRKLLSHFAALKQPSRLILWRSASGCGCCSRTLIVDGSVCEGSNSDHVILTRKEKSTYSLFCIKCIFRLKCKSFMFKLCLCFPTNLFHL